MRVRRAVEGLDGKVMGVVQAIEKNTANLGMLMRTVEEMKAEKARPF